MRKFSFEYKRIRQGNFVYDRVKYWGSGEGFAYFADL